MSKPTFTFSRRRFALHMLLTAPFAALMPAMPDAARSAEDAVAKRFDFLSRNGNSNCAQDFLDSISSMPGGARLQGSCCGPMALHRYREQIEGLKAFASISDVPPDPYDIEAVTAKRLLAAYDMQLRREQQKAYDEAMTTSAEKGPCCCECWRWNVFGGLGKLLIRDHGFGGAEVAEVWDLSNGCGGDSHAH